MKRIFEILSIAYFLLVIAACDKETPEQGGTSIDVQFPYTSYIFFNVSPQTKGELVYDNLINKTFAVTAYKYDGEWGTVSQGTCLPNVFWNFPVAYQNGTHVYDATDHILNDNIYIDGNGNQYKPSLIPWIDGMEYTFYAHYPYDEQNQNPKVSSYTDWHGEPYIDFTLPDKPEDMFDLMTAGLHDENNSVDNYVSFHMYHRLSAFDVYVSNNIQSIKVGGVDREVSVKIKDVKVIFDNLMYRGASFWMDRSYQRDQTIRRGFRSLTQFAANGTSKIYTILGEEPKSISNGQRKNVSGEVEKSLLIIPQTTDGSGRYLKGYVNFDCEFVDQDGNSVDVPLLQNDNTTIQVSQLTDQSMAFNVNKNVIAGYTYYLELAFVNGVITLRVQSAPTWDENIDLNLEFN